MTPSSAPHTSPPPASSAPSASPLPDFDRVAECFLALTARWQTERGHLGIGVPRHRLADALGGEIESTLAALRARVAGLGLELVEYRFGGEGWVCLRSLHVAPTELDDAQQGVLGVIVMLIERENHDGAERGRRQSKSLDGDQPKIMLARLHDLLVTSGQYLSRGRFDDILHALDSLGYIMRRSGKIQYGPRLLIEFPADARAAIAEQASRLIT